MKARYEKMSTAIPELEWELLAPEIEAIMRLKRQRNAIVLAHNYQTPDIYHGIADLAGDSLALARGAANTEAEVIVMCGVRFMAETAKLLNPGKKVLLPDSEAGCSLADSIGVEDIRELRRRHPGLPIVTYINTSVEVKAACDICCTSSNARQVVESLDRPQVIFVPDEYLAGHVAMQTRVEIIPWAGHCEVHERFTGDEIRQYRRNFAELAVIAHPECPPDVLATADFVGSTAQMISYVKKHKPPRVMLVTECSMSDNVAAEIEGVEFVRPCNLCPYMKKITLRKVRQALETLAGEIEIEPVTAAFARRCVERMLQVGV